MLDRKIEYFLTVVESGSFSEAGRKLFLSQANLSKQIAALENELGVKLFDRSGYRPVLTDIGEYLYQECVKIKAHTEGVLARVKEYGIQPVNVGFTGSFENREILDAVRVFQENYPDIDILLNRYDFGGCVDALLTKKIDVSFGLESTFRRYSEIKYDVLHDYDICFICAHNHPFAKKESVTINEIKMEKMIVLSRKFNKNFYMDFMDSCKQDGYIPLIKKEVDSFDEFVFSISIGEGAGIAGRSVVRENEVSAVHIDGTHHSSNYVIAGLENNGKANVQIFWEEIKKYFGTL